MLRRAPLAVIALLVAVASGLSPGQETEGTGGGVDGFVTRFGFPLRVRVELREAAGGHGLEHPLVAPGAPLSAVETDARGAFRFNRLGPGCSSNKHFLPVSTDHVTGL